jgi:choice-of-anchor A domain-containing protein
MTEIEKVNVIVLKDAAPSSADVEGRMWVGGDATFQGYSANSTNDPNLKLTCSEYGVVIGGDMTGTLILGSGAAAYGGSMAGGSFISNANPQCSIDHATPVDFVTLDATLKAYSAALLAHPVNGTTVFNYGALVLTGTDPKLNVFGVTAAQLNATTQVKFIAPVGSSIVVNVSGTVINWKNTGFLMPDGGTSCRNGNSDWCMRILYNLYEADTLNLNGIGVQGSVLAPFATVDGGSGNIDGQLVCEYLYGAIEYHPYFFNGCLQLPSP